MIPLLYVCLSVGVVIKQMAGARITTSPELRRTLSVGAEPIRGLAFDANRKLLAVAAGPSDGNLTLWQWTTGQKIQTIPVGQDLYCVAFSPDGTRLATNAHNNEIKIWDAASGKERSTLKGHSGFVWCVAFSPDGKYLASGSDDRTVRVWDLATSKVVQVLGGHGGMVASVAFSPRRPYLASGSDDRTIRIWDTGTGQVVRALPNQPTAVVRVAFSPDGGHLASTAGNSVRVWDVATGQATITMDNDYGDMVNDFVYSPDGKRLACACNPNRRDRPPAVVTVWDADRGKEIRSLYGHTHWGLSVVFLGDSDRLASGTGDGAVKIWDVSEGPPRK